MNVNRSARSTSPKRPAKKNYTVVMSIYKAKGKHSLDVLAIFEPMTSREAFWLRKILMEMTASRKRDENFRAPILWKLPGDNSEEIVQIKKLTRPIRSFFESIEKRK